MKKLNYNEKVRFEWTDIRERAAKKKIQLKYKFRWSYTKKPLPEKFKIPKDRLIRAFCKYARKSPRFRTFCFRQVNAFIKQKEWVEATFFFTKKDEEQSQMMLSVSDQYTIHTSQNEQIEFSFDSDLGSKDEEEEVKNKCIEEDEQNSDEDTVIYDE